MKKNIWIWNHYATDMYKNNGGRHYWFAENLIKQGYSATVFCANTYHNSSSEIISTKGQKWISAYAGEIPFVFVKTVAYAGNGLQRVLNMLMFYKNLFPVAKEYAKKNGKPDVILASSVHPLTLVAGIKIAKKFGVPCICEVRDLWPETLIAYGAIKKKSVIAKILYSGEEWIYKNANKLIFTMEGGKDYIVEKKWNQEAGGPVNLEKVYHINNGVDIELFDYNKQHYKIEDVDLENIESFKVIYMGAIRQVNRVGSLVDVAICLREKGVERVKILIWGEGDQGDSIQAKIEAEKLTNIVLKRAVPKEAVPYILSKSNLNVYILPDSSLYKYGISSNKSFEYFASGKPVLASANSGYSIIDRYQNGVCLDSFAPEKMADEIIRFANLQLEKYETYCRNANHAAQDYDFKVLTERLLAVMEKCQ